MLANTRVALRVLATFLVLFIAALPASAQEASVRSLLRSIDAALEDEKLTNSIWGIEVRDLATGDLLYTRNSNKSMLPASVTKLATTAAGLEQLGPDTRLRTELYATGRIEGGTLHGDLVIRGAGDPTIAENLPPWGYRGLLVEWIDSVRAAGVSRVSGDIIGDDDIFDDVPYGPGWLWDDVPYYYSPEVSGLAYNENVVRFSATGRRRGSAAELTWEPYTGYVTVVNETVTIPRDSSLVERYRRSFEDNVFVIGSRVPEGRVDREALAVHNPTLYFAHVLRETLVGAGIEVSGEPRDVDDLETKPDYDSDQVRLIASHQSPPLSEIAALINQPSHNLAAESMHKLLGTLPGPEESERQIGSWEGGARSVTRTLVRAGVDTARVRLVDGSGLSRMNLITPGALVRLLSYMWDHPDETVRAAYVNSLPVGGREGTLSSRFRTGSAAGIVRARTGTMTSVSGLAGYIERDNRPPLVFAILCNNYLTPARDVRRVQDEVVNLIARLSL